MSTGDGVAGQWGGVDVHFGEEGGRLTYGSYLRLAELLDQQRLESDPPAHDELLFITVHQVYELWFKQVLHELTASRDAMLADELWLAEHLLRRVHTIERVLTQQVDILETMTPQDFGEFRHRLSPASGFQSVQFREIEFLSGAKDASFVRRFRGLTEVEQERLLSARPCVRAACGDPITKSSDASTSSSRSMRPSARMSHSMPASTRTPFTRLLTARTAAACSSARVLSRPLTIGSALL
jgi:tryptophan 2,3-dioxygenase